jgi:hypothetical protein
MRRVLMLRAVFTGLAVLSLPAGYAGLEPVSVHLDPPVESGAFVPAESTPAIKDSVMQLVVGHNPFRAGRGPAAQAFLLVPPEPAYVEPPPPKPQLVLTGIVHGAEPGAIVEGLPGVEGARLLRMNESAGAIRVVSIAAGRVTLRGMDTTWVLQVRRPW